MSKKQNLGQFNTKGDAWLQPSVAKFIKNSDCDCVLDPFAGQGDLLHAAKRFDFLDYYGMDIDPDICTDKGWTWNDSLDEVPFHPDTLIITNPPYLAKNSAARNDLESYDYFEELYNQRFEDLYQIAMAKVLLEYKQAVFIIPETYFQTDFFKSYLHSYTIIEENPFVDTDCPVCVACFKITDDFLSITNNNYRIYKENHFLFSKHKLEDILFEFHSSRYAQLTFNDPNGNLGLRAVDGIKYNDRIRFCFPDELDYDLENVKESSRSITVIDVENAKIDYDFITTANYILSRLRARTQDVVLSPFKNNNNLGHRRRRLDYKWARKIIEKTMEALDK